jgi:hypothetical protein
MSSSKNTPKYIFPHQFWNYYFTYNLAFASHVIERPPNMMESNFPKNLHKYTSLNIEDLFGHENLKLL